MSSILKSGKYQGNTYKEVIKLDSEYCGEILSGFPILNGNTSDVNDMLHFKKYLNECLRKGSESDILQRIIDFKCMESISIECMEEKYTNQYAEAYWNDNWYKVYIESINRDKTLRIRWEDDGDITDFFPNILVKNVGDITSDEHYSTNKNHTTDDENDEEWFPGCDDKYEYEYDKEVVDNESSEESEWVSDEDTTDEEYDEQIDHITEGNATDEWTINPTKYTPICLTIKTDLDLIVKQTGATLTEARRVLNLNKGDILDTVVQLIETQTMEDNDTNTNTNSDTNSDIDSCYDCRGCRECIRDGDEDDSDYQEVGTGDGDEDDSDYQEEEEDEIGRSWTKLPTRPEQIDIEVDDCTNYGEWSLVDFPKRVTKYSLRSRKNLN